MVCTQNAHNPQDYADGTEPHGSAFLVGRISRISPVGDRWRIEFSEYARISQSDVWTGGRSPVRYTDLGALGIDVDGMDFQKAEPVATSAPPPATGSAALTITQAKEGLAKTYGVDVSSIEIVIRG